MKFTKLMYNDDRKDVNRTKHKFKQRRKKQMLKEKLKEIEVLVENKKFDEAEQLYYEIAKEYSGRYEPWLGLLNLYQKECITYEDEKYIKCIDKVLELCKNKKKRLELKVVCQTYEEVEDLVEHVLQGEEGNIIKEKNHYPFDSHIIEDPLDFMMNSNVVEEEIEIIASKKLDDIMNERDFTETIEEKNIPEEIQRYIEAAKNNDAAAQCKVGDYLYDKHIINDQIEDAFYWYTRASKQKYPEGFYKLAILYRDGKIVEKDYAKVIENFEEAANLGHNDAKIELGEELPHARGAFSRQGTDRADPDAL